MSKVVVYKGQYKITIPKELAEAKGWTSETRLRFVEDTNGNIILKEVRLENEKKGSKDKANKQ